MSASVRLCQYVCARTSVSVRFASVLFCLYVCVWFVRSFMCKSVRPCVCLSVCLWICLTGCLFICPFVCLSVRLFVYLSVLFFVCLPTSVSMCLRAYVCVRKSVSVSPCPYGCATSTANNNTTQHTDTQHSTTQTQKLLSWSSLWAPRSGAVLPEAWSPNQKRMVFIQKYIGLYKNHWFPCGFISFSWFGAARNDLDHLQAS